MQRVTEATERLVKEVADRIVERCRPQRIILFGSVAEGRATDASDIDLLVVMEGPYKPLDRILFVREVLKDLVVPVDIFVLRPEEYEETKDVIGGIAYPAAKYGKVIYEKS